MGGFRTQVEGRTSGDIPLYAVRALGRVTPEIESLENRCASFMLLCNRLYRWIWSMGSEKSNAVSISILPGHIQFN